MAIKESREKFDSLDHYKLNDCWNEFRNHYDAMDVNLKEVKLKKFVCKMPLDRIQRRALLKSINTPVE